MNFKINNRKWKIKELSQKEIKDGFINQGERPTETGKYFGVTWHDIGEIWLDKDLQEDRKKTTLIHELSHCYIGNYINHLEKQYDEEQVCDIVANSHEIINTIVNKYFSKK